MNVQAELAKAIGKRFDKVNGGVEEAPKDDVKQSRKTNRRQDPELSEAQQAARRKANKSAAAALMAKMNAQKAPSTSDNATGKTSTPANKGPLSKTEEENAQRYRKMMRMKMPEGAVRHKMISDGMSERIIEAVMSGDEPSRSQSPTKQNSSGNISGRKSSLSPEEEKTAAQYRKMMRMKMPEGAVRHKMNRDGVPAKIQESVLKGEVPAQSSSSSQSNNTNANVSSLSKEEEKTAAQYRKMMRMKMPEGAVRHKMNRDGVPAKIQESVLKGEVPAQSSPPSSSSQSNNTNANFSSLSKEEEKTAAQYRKMMRMKMPEGAVRHKMNRDGVPAKIQESVLKGEIPAQSSPPPSSSQSNNTNANVSSLSKEEEKTAAQYRKMMRMKMPEGAVRHKMNRDGVPAKIQESVLKGEVPAQSSPPSSSSQSNNTNANFSSLSKDEEKTAAQYRKMMRMKMPEGAVRHKMTRDGISATIQNSVLRGEIPRELSPGDSGGNSNVGSVTLPMRSPKNPMAAAIASSSGISSLKKSPVNEKKISEPASSSESKSKEEEHANNADESSGFWKSVVDPKSGRTYYYHTETEKTTWKKPEGFTEYTEDVDAVASEKSPSIQHSSSNTESVQSSEESKNNNTVTNESTPSSQKSIGKEKSVQSSCEESKSNTVVVNERSPSIQHSSSNTKSVQPSEESKSSDVVTNESNPSSQHSNKKEKSVQSSEKSRDKSRIDMDENKSSGFWKSVVDPKSERTYYYHTETQKTTWKKPEGYTEDVDIVASESNLSSKHPSNKEKSIQSSEKSRDKSDVTTNKNNSPRRLSGGIKIKSVRSPEESPKRTAVVTNNDTTPRRLSGSIKVKSVRSREESLEKSSIKTESPTHQPAINVKPVKSPEKPPLWDTDTSNVSPRRLSGGIKIKSVRLVGESSERSDSVNNGSDSPRVLSGIKIKPITSSEEKIESHPSVGSRNKNLTNSNFRNELETNLKRNKAHETKMTKKHGTKMTKANETSRNQSTKTAEDSQRSAMRKAPNRKQKNSDKKRQNHGTYVTGSDGVDHHCQCVLM